MPVLVDRLIIARLAFVTVLFSGAAALVSGFNGWRLTVTVIGLLATVSIFALLSFIYLVLLLRYPQLRLSRSFLAVQYVIDAVLILIPVALTNGTTSPFVTLYVLLIVIVALTHSFRFALTMSLLSCSLVAFLSFMEVQGYLPGIDPPGRTELVRDILVRDFVNFGMFFLLGLLPAKVAQELQSAGRYLDFLMKDYQLERELHRMVVDTVPSGIILMDRKNRTILKNRSADSILNQSQIGEAIDLLQQIERSDIRESGQLVVDNSGEKKTIGFSVSAVDPDIFDGATLVVFQDVTERVRLSETLERQRHLSAIGQLSANLAHEVRNPLAGISNSLQLLSGRLELEEEERRLFAIQEYEIARLNRLVSDFLKFARPEADNSTELNLREQLQIAIHKIKNDPQCAGHAIEVEFPEADVAAKVDGDILQSVVMNLLLNAVQWGSPDTEICVSAVVNGEEIWLDVANKGPLIPDELASEIFEPFVSHRKGGSGLGLAVAWSGARAIGGSLSLVKSDRDSTLFRLKVPLERVG